MSKKIVIENFFSLSLLQAANYIFPLVTFPYLVRVLGPSRYGLIIFAQALIQYFIMATDYGFTLTAPRDISVLRHDTRRVLEIFSSVLTIKVIIMSLSFFILTGLVLFVPRFHEDAPVYFLTFGLVIGSALFPLWFFQGMEKIKHAASIVVATKGVFTIAIFFYVHKASDYLYVPLLNSIGSIISGVVGLLIVFYHFKIRFHLPTLLSMQQQLKAGWHVFISTVSISFHTATNTFLLGLFSSTTVVAYYAAGEKIVGAIIQLFYPLFQALYPHISRLVTESRERALQKLRRLCVITWSSSFLLFCLILLYAPVVVSVVLGNQFDQSILIVRLLSPLIFIIPFAFILANLTLLPFNLDKYFSRIYLSGVAIHIVVLFLALVIFKAGASGVAISNLITETILTIYMYLTLRGRGIHMPV